MPGGLGVMMLLKDIYLYLIDGRNIHTPVIQDHSMRVGGERLKVWRIFIASRQGGVTYLREVGTDFGVLVEGSEDVMGMGVFAHDRSGVDSVKEISGENRMFRIQERGVHLLQFQEGHGTFAHVFAKGIIEATGQGVRFPALFAMAEDNFEIEP